MGNARRGTAPDSSASGRRTSPPHTPLASVPQSSPLRRSTSAHSAPHPSLSFCNVGISAHKRSIYCMFFVHFFVNDFSTPHSPIHAKFCMRTYSGSRCVFSPFGGKRPQGGGAEKEGNEIFVKNLCRMRMAGLCQFY